MPIIHHARQWLKSRLDFIWKSAPTLLWLVEPPPLNGKKVCLMASFSVSGKLSRHTLFLAQQWQLQGFMVILVVASDNAQALNFNTVEPLGLSGLVLRRNSGYDFGSWASIVKSRPDIRDAQLLAMANDSLYGPLHGFPELLSRVYTSRADVIALTDSYQVAHHIQSYLVFYKPTALKSSFFHKLWHRKIFGYRYEIIMRAEVPLLKKLIAAGANVEVLFPTLPGSLSNPTIDDWRTLIEKGFPFIKVQLLRDKSWREDLLAWDKLLEDHSYDPMLVYEHLGESFSGSAAALTSSAEFKDRVRHVELESSAT